MGGPFIFIGTHRIKEGQLDAFKQDCQALTELVHEREPQLHSLNFFFNDDETEVSVVQVHPDADSMLTQTQVAQEHITTSTEEQLITKDIQISGTPNEAVTGMITQLSQEGVPLVVKPAHFVSFSRT